MQDPRPTEPRSRTRRSLSQELRRTFRTLFAGVLATVLVLVAMAAVLVGYVQPDLRYDTEAIRAVRINHEAMLAHEMGLREWLASQRTLAYVDHEGTEAAVDAAAADIVDVVGRDARIDRSLLAMLVAQRSWLDAWAGPAMRIVPAELDDAERRAFVNEGHSLFHTYREAQATAVDLAAEERDEALNRSQWVVLLGLGVSGLATVAVAVTLTRQRRRLDHELAEPLEALRDAMASIERQEATDLSELAGPRELQELAEHLHHLDVQLAQQRRALEAERAESETAAVALRSILAVAKEISGSLNIRYVAETVADATVRIVRCDAVRVWVTGENDADLVAIHDTTLGHGQVPKVPHVALGAGLVGAVARDAAVGSADRDVAFPLVVGGRVVGVLEIVGGAGLGEDRRSSAETLASHAAAALEAARLHRATEELAQVDVLTRLYNRRRLEGDLATEVERATRYGRPLGIILLDLDRFKTLNDTFGHQYGDEVLRATGELLAGAVRSSDTVYRYGGEEFLVLVREGDRSSVLELAERLREQLTRTLAEGDLRTTVTASFGAALVPEHGVTPAELMLAADRALYRAKDQGRDRVVLAELPGSVTTR